MWNRLIKRAAIVGRLFYHTSMCLLAQINPLKHPHHDDDETRTVQLHHAHQVCGIVAHNKDQGVSSVAIRSVAVVGCVLTEPGQQHEVLAILNRIYSGTGWNLKKVVGELRKAWGWDPSDLPPPGIAAPGTGASLAVSASALPPPTINPGTQGDTLCGVAGPAVAMHHQHFIGGPRDSAMHHSQDARRPSQSQSQSQPQPQSQPPPPPLLLPQICSSSFPTTEQRQRQPSLSNNHISNMNNAAGGASAPATLPSYLNSINAIAGGGGSGGRPNSIAGSSSNHPSPSGGTTVHTPGSVSSTVANAATPPASRPMVNPLLAQADFNQPNHPYREWYKPPEKGGHNWFGSSGGGLWP